MPATLTKEASDGYTAALAGQKEDTCPYPHYSDEEDEWLRGYNEGQDQLYRTSDYNL